MVEAIRRKTHGTTLWWTLATLAVGALAMWLYFHYEHDTSHFIRSLGPYGVIAAILLMAALCVVPFPAEFLMILDMQVYGVWLGILYVWVGAMLGSLATFWFAKQFGDRLVKRFIQPRYVDKLKESLSRHGSLGLLMARLIPFIPFVVLNYASAMLSEVKTWTYLWTTGVGIMPYDAGAALVYLGFSRRILLWLVLGGVAVFLIWLLAIYRTRRARMATEPSPADRSGGNHAACVPSTLTGKVWRKPRGQI